NLRRTNSFVVLYLIFLGLKKEYTLGLYPFELYLSMTNSVKTNPKKHRTLKLKIRLETLCWFWHFSVTISIGIAVQDLIYRSKTAILPTIVPLHFFYLVQWYNFLYLNTIVALLEKNNYMKYCRLLYY